MAIDLKQLFIDVESVKEVSRVPKGSVLTTDTNLKKSFIASLNRSLCQTKEFKLITRKQLLNQAKRFYVTKYNLKKDLLFDKHYEGFLEDLSSMLKQYSVLFRDGNTEELVVY